MLSLAPHHYSPVFGHMQPEMRNPFQDPPRSCGPHQRIQTSNLEPIDTSLPYASPTPSPVSHTARRSIGPMSKHGPRSRHAPYDTSKRVFKSEDTRSGTESATDSRSTSGPVRRRISRACDQCNQLRTKCDGMNPCAHCLEFGLTCEYFRERKKRGKASRKDIAAQQAKAAAAAASGSSSSDENASTTASVKPASVPCLEGRKRANSDMVKPSQPAVARSRSSSGGTPLPHAPVAPEMVRSHSMTYMHEPMPFGSHASSLGQIQEGMMINEWQHMAMSHLHTPTSDINGSMIPTLPSQLEAPQAFHYPEAQLHMMTPDPSTGAFPFPSHMDSPMNNFMAGSSASSPPAWLSLPSPSVASFGSQGLVNPNPNLRYPVLQPLVAKLANILPIAVACDLLDIYFASSTAAYLRPSSPYLLGFIFRRAAFLHPTNPRKCSPALLASMLWVAAQTSDASFLTSPPSARGRICQKLLELTVSLLQPLIHGGSETPTYGHDHEVDGINLGGLGMANDAAELTSQTGGTGTLDDVATYFHLATVISASEHKAASMRWWTQAFTLARELKLGREMPALSTRSRLGDEEDAHGEFDGDMREHGANGLNFGYSAASTSPVSEEEREERRRLWWLLYTVDRHLALCYNRPLFLLDGECSDLLQPASDDVWQAGEVYCPPEQSLFPDARPVRTRGPAFECTSHSIFGFFTPLMTILGEIVELQQARNHPRFGILTSSEENQRVEEITRHIETYEHSLRIFEAHNSNEAVSPRSHNGRPASAGSMHHTEATLQTKTVVAYGSHVLHVLHILLTGKWDPISLLDDSDLWIASQSFVYATQHSVAGAEAVARILELDPDLAFMPFFFGIYLLQGSFLLLLIADKLRSEASASVVGACDVVVRAIEACVATLSTEYQRNFRKVMRSALAQVKGRIPEDFGEASQRRREVLALYRWTSEGTGLAL